MPSADHAVSRTQTGGITARQSDISGLFPDEGLLDYDFCQPRRNRSDKRGILLVRPPGHPLPIAQPIGDEIVTDVIAGMVIRPRRLGHDRLVDRVRQWSIEFRCDQSRDDGNRQWRRELPDIAGVLGEGWEGKPPHRQSHEKKPLPVMPFARHASLLKIDSCISLKIGPGSDDNFLIENGRPISIQRLLEGILSLWMRKEIGVSFPLQTDTARSSQSESCPTRVVGIQGGIPQTREKPLPHPSVQE